MLGFYLKNMEKEFVPYQESLELKKLGFDEPCFGFYIKIGEWIPASYSRERIIYPSNKDLLPEWVTSVTYSQAFRLFREKYGINVVIDRVTNNEWTYTGYNFNLPKVKEISEEGLWTTYEEAELACLRKLIEIVKQK